jgi:hypothetical protein
MHRDGGFARSAFFIRYDDNAGGRHEPSRLVRRIIAKLEFICLSALILEFPASCSIRTRSLQRGGHCGAFLMALLSEPELGSSYAGEHLAKRDAF